MTDAPPGGGGGGTIKTPFGHVKKNTAYMAGAVIVVMAILYYRSRQSAAAAATAASGASTGINPATGYTYGSAEDAAALANQASYQLPSGFGGGGNGGGGSGVGGFTSNAQWAQAAEQYMSSVGAVSDSTMLAAALGKYLTGQPLTADMKSLTEQAIAFEGYPPVAGPNGFPPSINTSPTPGPNPAPGPTSEVFVTGGTSVVPIMTKYGWANNYNELWKWSPNAKVTLGPDKKDWVWAFNQVLTLPK